MRADKIKSGRRLSPRYPAGSRTEKKPEKIFLP